MAWRLSVLREVLKYHRAEREILLSIMMDTGSDDLRDAAKQMTQEEREQRLMELRKKAEGLNLDVKGNFFCHIFKPREINVALVGKSNWTLVDMAKMWRCNLFVTYVTLISFFSHCKCILFYGTLKTSHQWDN